MRKKLVKGLAVLCVGGVAMGMPIGCGGEKDSGRDDMVKQEELENRRKEKMKKKMLCLVLTVVVCLGMLVGCGSGNVDKEDDASQQEVQNDKADDETDDKADAANGEANDGKITETVTLSGTYYSGKVIITLKLNPDGTIGGEANGETLEGTWSESEEADIEAITAGSNEMKFLVTKESDGSYSATVDKVAGMVLTGK